MKGDRRERGREEDRIRKREIERAQVEDMVHEADLDNDGRIRFLIL
jgi:hypothetical protein